MRRAPRPASRIAARSLAIELLALDLTTCGRCTRTESNLDSALASVAERLRRDGVAVEVRKTVVRTAEQAERLRFASSPTVRVDGRDIALALRESDCGDCGDLCGCAGSVECRVWPWRGREHLEAPEEMIVDAVLRAAREGPIGRPEPAPPFRLPDNLRRFFAAREAAGASEGDRPPSAGSCCGSSGACGCGPIRPAGPSHEDRRGADRPSRSAR